MRLPAWRAVDPFEGPKAWRLTECLDCGVQAHYRLVYTIEKNAVGEKTCRACYWKAWAKEARALSGEVFPGRRTYSTAEIIAHLDANGFDFIATTGEVTDGYEPVITPCRSCRRISADRMGDIGWGCSCSRNARSTTSTSSTAAATASRKCLRSPCSCWWFCVHQRPLAPACASGCLPQWDAKPYHLFLVTHQSSEYDFVGH